MTGSKRLSRGQYITMLPTLSRRDAIGGAIAAAATLLPATSVPAQARFRWPLAARGALSLTFDDGLVSQLSTALPMLDQRGMRGTFFLTGASARLHAGEWRAAAARGHELGNHSSSHPCNLGHVRIASYDQREIEPVELLLDGLEGQVRPRSFAYPCDVTNLGAGTANQQSQRFHRLLARDGIDTARTSEGLPNNPRRLFERRYRLQALAVGYDARKVATVMHYLARAIRHGSWAILVFHGFTPTASALGEFGAQDFGRLLDLIETLPLWCAPLGEVAEYIAGQLEAEQAASFRPAL